MRISVLSLMTLAVCMATSSILHAQNADPKAAQDDPFVTRVFHLAHANAMEMQGVLDETPFADNVNATAVQQSNQLLVTADRKSMEKVAELIEQLDQPSRDPAEGGDRSIEIIKLEKLAPEDAVGLIQALLTSPDRKSTLMVVADPNSGSIIARGTPAELGRVEDFLRKYETQLDDDATVTEVVELRNQPADAVYELLESINIEPVIISRPDDLQKLLLQGPQRDVERILETIAQIDRPEASLHLTFFLVRSSPEPQEGRPIPESLHPALAALEETGFENPHLLTTLTIRTLENSEFTASGTIENDRVSIEGEARLLEGKGAVQIRVETEVTRRRPVAQDGVRQNDEVPLFHAATQILTPVGDSVVVVSAPGPEGSGFPIALILQARPVD